MYTVCNCNCTNRIAPDARLQDPSAVASVSQPTPGRRDIYPSPITLSPSPITLVILQPIHSPFYCNGKGPALTFSNARTEIQAHDAECFEYDQRQF